MVAPTDATVGDTVDLRIAISGRRRRASTCARSIRRGDVVAHRGARRRACSRTRPCGAACSGRCACSSARSAPLGVFVRTRTVRVALPAPIVVAPRPERRARGAAARPRRAVSPRVRRCSCAARGDTVRAVRPYAPGDPARLVHWPTSARRGEIVVREHEPPPALGDRARRRPPRDRPTPPEAAASLRRRDRYRDARRRGRRVVRHLRRRRAASARSWPMRATSGAASRAPTAGDRRPSRPTVGRRKWCTHESDPIRSGHGPDKGATPATRRVAPAYRIVAIPAALALGSVGGIAAEHANFPWILGALAGGARRRARRARAAVDTDTPGDGRPPRARRARRAPARVVRGCRSQLAPRDLGRGDDAHARAGRPGRRGDGSRARRAVPRCRTGSGRPRASAAIIGLVVIGRRRRARPDRDGPSRPPCLARACNRGFATATAAPSSLTVERRARPHDPAPALDAVVFTVDASRRRLLAGRDVRRLQRDGSGNDNRSSWSSSAPDPDPPHEFLPHDGTQRRQSRPTLYDDGAQDRQRVPPDVPHARRGSPTSCSQRRAPGSWRPTSCCTNEPDGTVRVESGKAGSRRASARARSTPSRAVASR